jgi:hypothetical protein
MALFVSAARVSRGVQHGILVFGFKTTQRKSYTLSKLTFVRTFASNTDPLHSPPPQKPATKPFSPSSSPTYTNPNTPPAQSSYSQQTSQPIYTPKTPPPQATQPLQPQFQPPPPSHQQYHSNSFEIFQPRITVVCREY